MHDPTANTTAVSQQERVQAFFDASRAWQGDFYADGSGYFGRLLQRRQHLVAHLLDGLPYGSGRTALDCGCGSGVYLETLVARGYAATGLDLSPGMLEACTRRFAGAGNGRAAVRLVQGDVESLPFADHSFDVVLCIGVLGYLLEDAQALREITRVLKPGGSVIINVTNAFSLSDLDTRLRHALVSAVRRKRGHASSGPPLPYAIRSAWMEQNRQYANKSYRLGRFEQLLGGFGLACKTSLTFGYEFRVLRRYRLVPEAVLDGLERVLERLVRAVKVPYLSRSGWGYVGLFTHGPAPDAAP